MGLFNVLVSVKEEGITALELAEKTSSDEIFISKYFPQKKWSLCLTMDSPHHEISNCDGLF